MLGNLKEFISVVQDGLTSHNNLRQTLQEVQKVTNIFKDKSFKQKVSNESKVNYGAGGDLLEKYQENWVELHANADKNARSADEVDKLIQELHETTKIRLQSANDLTQALAHLPNLTASVAQCLDGLKNVKTLLQEVEEQLVDFEDLVERRNMEKWKLDHHYHLSLYKEKKMATLEEIRMQLAKENTEQNIERERKQLAELQAKRENSAAAFENDVAKYLSSGSVPKFKDSSVQPNISLEQIQLEDDNTDLEKFLES